MCACVSVRLLRFDEYRVMAAMRLQPTAATAASARRVAAKTSSGPMSRMQRWWPSRQIGLWQGRQSSALLVSIVAASGLSGAQCQGLVGPKMPIDGVPSAAATWSRPESLETAAAPTPAPGWRRAGRARSGRGRRLSPTISAASGFLVGAAQHPDREALGEQAAGQRGIGRARPALGRSDRAGRQRHDRPAVGGKTATGAPSGDLGAVAP